MNPRHAIASILAAASLTSGIAATFTVTTTAPDGPGSFGQAVLDANAAPGPDVIEFGIAGEGVQTITLSASLPTISEAVTVDATTQPGYAGIPLVVINGNFRRNVSGLTINATGCTVRGLAIVNCGTSGGSSRMWGLVIEGGGQHHIEGCYLGLDTDGITAKRNRDGGILVSNSVNNVIGGLTAAARNVISGNSASGVVIAGAGASNNVVAGNFIGLTAAGTAKLANSTFALRIQDGASANRIGGTEAGTRNVIAGNNGTTLEIAAGTTGTLVQGNFIGLRADGETLAATPSSSHGVAIQDSAGNLVGGTAAGAGNVLSGNQFAVLINGAGASNNVVQGNLIGTDPTGKAARPNHLGVSVGSGATENRIGGVDVGARNVISANVTDGVSLNGASRNRVQGNFIGTDITGLAALGNGQPNGGSGGVTVSSAGGPAADNLIGGATAVERNVVSGNLVPGIVVVGSLAERTRIQGNYVGLAADGTTALGNQADGILVLGAVDTWIGTPPTGATTGARAPRRAAPPPPLSSSGNWIYANLGNGVAVKRTFGATGDDSKGTTITDNSIAWNGGAGINELAGVHASRNIILPPTMPPANWQPIDWMGDGISNPNSPDNAVNAPTFAQVSWDALAKTLRATGAVTVPAQAGRDWQMELFGLPSADSAGLHTYLGAATGTTDDSGEVTLDTVIPLTGDSPPEWVAGVFIISDADGNQETSQPGATAAVSGEDGCPPMQVAFEAPKVVAGVSLDVGGTVGGGTAPYRDLELVGTLPAGLSLTRNLAAGSFQLTGTPSMAGDFPFRIIAADANRCTVGRDIVLTVACAPITFDLVGISLDSDPTSVNPRREVVIKQLADGASFTSPSSDWFLGGAYVVARGGVPPVVIMSDVFTGAGNRLALGFSGAAPGTYTLKMTATDAAGCKAEITCTVNVEAPPQLTPALQSDGKLQVGWTSEFTGYQLQSTDNLGGGAWKPVLITPVQQGNQFSVEVPDPGDGSAFYRLGLW